LFLVLLYGLGSYFLVPFMVKGPLAEDLSEKLERPVAVERVIFSPFTWRVFLQDITVGPQHGEPGRENLLQCPEVHCRLDPLALRHGRVVCRETRIAGATLNLVLSGQGEVSLAAAADIFSLFKKGGGEKFRPGWLVLDGVTMTEGTVTVNDTIAGREHIIEDIRFYLPPAAGAGAANEAAPRLDAVINSSPVQVDGRRQKNERGEMETVFSASFSDVVLTQYRDYLPTVEKNPLRLEGGQADMLVKVVIPEGSRPQDNLYARLDVRLDSLHYVNSRRQKVLSVPEGRLEVRAIPARNLYIVEQAEFVSPEFAIDLRKGQDAERPGLTRSEIEEFARAVERHPRGIRIETFSMRGATLSIFGGQKNDPRYVWKECELHLSGLANEAARGKTRTDPAVFRISVRDGAGDHGASLRAEGEMRPSFNADGSLSLQNVDLKKYQLRLPGDAQFSEGVAGLEAAFAFSGAPTGNGSLRFSGGDLVIRNYAMQRGSGTVLAGGEVSCGNMEADFVTRTIQCVNIGVRKSRIEADGIGLAYLSGAAQEEGGWSLTGQDLQVEDSSLHISLPNPLAPEKKTSISLEKFSLRADSPGKEKETGTFTASGMPGGKGRVAFEGTYAAAAGRGRLAVDLTGAEVNVFKEFITPWFIPEISGGTVDIRGTYAIGEKTFTGRARVKNLRTGREGVPSLQWREAVAENIFIQAEPFALECPEIAVIEPTVSFGISHAEMPANLFLQPSGPEGAGNGVRIHRLRFTGGTLHMPEPVIFQGYQPDLTSVSGTLSPVGADPMYFTAAGLLSGQGRFSLKATAGMTSVSGYSLEVAGLPLAPFHSFFADGIGLDVSTASASWQQEMRRPEGGCLVETRLRAEGVVPEPDTPYAKVLALYTDRENALAVAEEYSCREKEEQPFLFEVLEQRIKQDAVRADLSEHLVLARILPGLNLPGRAGFVPGTATLVVTKELADYELLLARRPYLGLQLTGIYDPEKDRAALKELLQQRADADREAENRRRAEERRRLQEIEEQRLAELPGEPGQVVEEEISPVELAEDLQPLPHREVRVEDFMLRELAARRAKVLRAFFIDGLLIDPDRIHIAEDGTGKDAEARIGLQPYFPEHGSVSKVGGHDTQAH
jgi:hypothetical protein